jgi:hypothetical protein
MKKSLLVIVIAFAGLAGLACGGGTTKPVTITPKTPAPAWDWAGVIGTGQSLSVGVMGNPETQAATTPMFDNLKLSLGTLTVPPIPDPTTAVAGGQLSMVPLVEPIRTLSTGSVEWPNNIFGETPHTAMADTITALYQAAGGTDYVTAHTVVGESGKGMQYIQKGAVDDGTEGRAYAASMFEVAAIHGLAAAAGKSYGVGAVAITHGEADSGNTDYENELAQMQADYTADAQAVTGQTEPVVLLVSQQNSVPNTLPADLGMGSVSTLAQWQVGLDHPGLAICIGPKYQYPYFSDGVHLMTDGYDRLGEKFGEVYHHAVVLGDGWQPLQPVSASASGSVISVQFHVPVGPLAWDDAIVAPQKLTAEWVNGRGFEVTLASAPETIVSVAITGAAMDTVEITCADTVEGQYVSVAYAYSAAGGITQTVQPDGYTYLNTSLRWGQLRDSDPFVGPLTGVPQPNYAVAFSVNVPYASPLPATTDAGR